MHSNGSLTTHAGLGMYALSGTSCSLPRSCDASQDNCPPSTAACAHWGQPLIPCQTSSTFLQQKHPPGMGPPSGRKPHHSPLHGWDGAQLPSPWERGLSSLLSQAFGFCWLWSSVGVMMVEEGTLARMQSTAKAALSPGRLLNPGDGHLNG